MASRRQNRRPRSAGQGRSRADWIYPDMHNEYSDRTFSSRFPPASRERSPSYQDDRRRGRSRDPLGNQLRSGIPSPICNAVGPQARENRLGLYGQDGGFVSGSRFAPDLGTGQLTSFHRLGFGQEPERTQYVHHDDHEQASHPIVHRHAPLGMPRRLGSGPDEFEKLAWDSSHPRGYGSRSRLQQNLSPRGNASRGHSPNGHPSVNRKFGPQLPRQNREDYYSPSKSSNPSGGWSPGETYSPTMPEWSPPSGTYSPSRPSDLPDPNFPYSPSHPHNSPRTDNYPP